MRFSKAKILRGCAIRKRTRRSAERERFAYMADRTLRIVRLERSQYRYTINPQRYAMVTGQIYPLLKERALLPDEVCELHIGKDAESAVICCVSKYMLFFKEDVQAIFAQADEVEITPLEDGSIRMELTYSICDRTQIADYSRKIQALKACRP